MVYEWTLRGRPYMMLRSWGEGVDDFVTIVLRAPSDKTRDDKGRGGQKLSKFSWRHFWTTPTVNDQKGKSSCQNKSVEVFFLSDRELWILFGTPSTYIDVRAFQ